MNKIKTDGIDPKVESGEDKAHRVVRTMLSAMPGVGGPAVELFNTLLTPPLEKRKLKWMREVSNTINDLIDQGAVTLERLQANEEFISLLAHTSQIAIRNHDETKLGALKNATINSIEMDVQSESIRYIHVNLIDKYTPAHIIILRHIGQLEGHVYFPEKYPPTDLIDTKIGINGHLANVINQDLEKDGLIEYTKFENGYKGWKLTSFGKDFIDFTGLRIWEQ